MASWTLKIREKGHVGQTAASMWDYVPSFYLFLTFLNFCGLNVGSRPVLSFFNLFIFLIKHRQLNGQSRPSEMSVANRSHPLKMSQVDEEY